MSEGAEPRALSAALAAPPFATKAGGAAMFAAGRHLDRWAPEGKATRLRPLGNLAFVDNVISPWFDAATRSVGMRMFGSYAAGLATRDVRGVSWVFPRPWYEDELNWLAAAREAPMAARDAGMAARPTGPQVFTARGTFEGPGARGQASARAEAALPVALYEYVAPTLGSQGRVAADGISGQSAYSTAYSPLVPFAAASASHVMTQALAPLASVRAADAPFAAHLRGVMASMLARATVETPATRSASAAPELVTPPSPRDERAAVNAAHVVEHAAAQRAQLDAVERIARDVAARDLDERARVASAPAPSPGQPNLPPTRATSVPRPYEQARAAAERDARVTATMAPAAPSPQATPQAERAVRPEIVAALGSVSPEIAALLSERVASGQPGAIAELREALRTAELLAHASARGETLEATRGPRLMLPAMLGALPLSIEQARATGARDPGAARVVRPFIPASIASAEGMLAAGAVGPRRDPMAAAMFAGTVFGSNPYISRPFGGRAIAAGALDAVASSAPAALGHIAWTDRWLGRFAGAGERSLATFATTSEQRLGAFAFAADAPSQVFVAPRERELDGHAAEQPGIGAASAPVGARPSTRPVAAPSASPTAVAAASASTASVAAQAAAAARASEPQVVRFDDDGETPDDVFAAIAQAAASARRAPQRAAARTAHQPAAAPTRSETPAMAKSATAQQPSAEAAYARLAPADVIANTAPRAPHAGLSAQLASSPFATVLHHMLPLAFAPSFDVRALFGAHLASTFLTGSFESRAEMARQAPEWEAAYVAAGPDEQAASRGLAGGRAPDQPFTTGALQFGAGTLPASAGAAQLPTGTSQLPSRAALLAFEVASGDFAAPRAAYLASSMPRAMLEATTLPMLGDIPTAEHEVPTAPGAFAERAHAWSVAHERSSADLAFDFVSPELVLAARVYGLGPAEAAQAARLAVGGPGRIASMAGAIDRTFLAAMAVERDARDPQARNVEVAPGAAPATAAAGRPGIAAAAGQRPLADAADAELGGTRSAASSAVFGVERRVPRGVTLWPSAAVAALGLDATTADGAPSTAIAALELLAARAVAELGAFAVPAQERAQADAVAAASEATSEAIATAPGPSHLRAQRGAPGLAPIELDASTPSLAAEQEILSVASSGLAPQRREKFAALYLALGQSPARAMSPAARAARALALAGRGDDAITARERAAIAWEVLPHVLPGGSDQAVGDQALGAAFAASAAGRAGVGASPAGIAARQATSFTGTYATPATQTAAAIQAEQRRLGRLDLPDTYVDSRPGLASLTARAGEALGSYVAPVVVAPSESGSSSRESGAVLRAPSAAQELVRPERRSGRHGGGEVEIPPWFEAAARKMFEDKGAGDVGITLAELTLVTAAPATQVAASTRTPPSAAPPAPAPSARAGGTTEDNKIDIEKVANEVYRQILSLMDAARARNGEPYL